jgi:hypothetical protein
VDRGRDRPSFGAVSPATVGRVFAALQQTEFGSIHAPVLKLFRNVQTHKLFLKAGEQTFF